MKYLKISAKYIIPLLLSLLAIIIVWYSAYREKPIDVIPIPQNLPVLNYPIDGLKERITKKPFGIYVTPQNSPVKPERFTGYHTGVDVEYEDIKSDIPVFAVADGQITLARTASGYGGVLILEVILSDGKPHSILYGHLRPNSLPKVGQDFKKGDQLGVLGTEFTSETDYERRHLHFAVLSNNRIGLKGYVQSISELKNWINPLSLYN